MFAMPDGLNVVRATPSADIKSFNLSLAEEKPFSEAFTANVFDSSLYHDIKKTGIKQMPKVSKIWPNKFDTYKYANIILKITQPAPQIPTIAPGMKSSTVIATKPKINNVIIPAVLIN